MATPEPEHVAVSRIAYDHIVSLYLDAVGSSINPRYEAPLDRAILTAFAEELLSSPAGEVIDVGCGPGRMAAFLSGHGIKARGVDIAPNMIEAALSAHPQLRFDVGTLTEVGGEDHSAAGAIYWYSIITTPLEHLPEVWAELDRVLTVDGRVLVAFQSGENVGVERPDAYGSDVLLTLMHQIKHLLTGTR